MGLKADTSHLAPEEEICMVIRVFLLMMLLCLPVFAGGVGYVNYDKVVANYQFAKTSLREIETKNNEIQQYL